MWYNWNDEIEIETMKTLLESYRTNTRVIQTVIFVQEITERSFLIKIVQSSKNYYICAYCGRFLKKKDVTVDHIISIRKSSEIKDFAVYSSIGKD